MNPRTSRLILGITLLTICQTGLARYYKDNDRAPLDKSYVQECGSCHVAYPAEFLDKESWQALLAGLSDHFKSDVSLDEPALKPINTYLFKFARGKGMDGSSPKPVRVSTSRWFKQKHNDTESAGYPGTLVKTLANCSGCHPKAEENRYHDLAKPNF